MLGDRSLIFFSSTTTMRTKPATTTSVYSSTMPLTTATFPISAIHGPISSNRCIGKRLVSNKARHGSSLL
jgi:hypothetical protein